MISNSVERSVHKCYEITRYHISPFRCFYFNPRKYTPVELMKWSQKYIMNRMYAILLDSAKITGYEVVPSELLLNNGSRNGYSDRMIKIGRSSFYLLKTEEMSRGLRKRLEEFKQKMTELDSNSITINESDFSARGRGARNEKTGTF